MAMTILEYQRWTDDVFDHMFEPINFFQTTSRVPLVRWSGDDYTELGLRSGLFVSPRPELGTPLWPDHSVCAPGVGLTPVSSLFRGSLVGAEPISASDPRHLLQFCSSLPLRGSKRKARHLECNCTCRDVTPCSFSRLQSLPTIGLRRSDASTSVMNVCHLLSRIPDSYVNNPNGGRLCSDKI